MKDSSKQRIAYFLRRVPLSQRVLRMAVRFFTARFTVGVIGIVLNERDEVLLVEHVYHTYFPWGLPGGWLDRREAPVDGLAREVREETGLAVDVLEPVLVDRPERRSRHLDMAFVCRARPGVVTLSSELLDYKWLPVEEMPELVLFHQDALRAYATRYPAEK